MKYSIPCIYLLIVFSLVSNNSYSQDYDNDGIPDIVDLDDDNDGILDSIECDATGTSLGDSNTLSELVYFQDFEGLPRLDNPLLNDGSEGFTTDLFHFSGQNSSLGININTAPQWNATPGAVPDGSEYMIASDFDGTPGNGNVLWNIATNGTVPAILPSIINEPSGDFLLVNSFSDLTSSYNSNSMFTLDDNDGDGNPGEIFSADNIRLDRNGVYDFAVFITDITNVGGNNNFYTFEVFDAINGTLIANVTNGFLPLDNQWHLISLEFFITDASFSAANVNREVNLAFRQNRNLGSGADIGIDNVFVAYRSLDTDEDGIANCNDLDSDGDGCPDAYEGGGSFTNGDLNVDYNLNGGPTDVFYNLGVGTDTDNDGLLDIVEPSGQGLGSGLDNTVANCPLVIDFDGVDDVVKAPNTFNLNGWDQLTLQFWVKSNMASQLNAGVIGQKGVIEFTHDNGYLQCKLFSNGNEKTFFNPTWLGNTNNWEHITLVYNNGLTQIFHNGVKQYEDVDLSLSNLETSLDPFIIGGPVSSSGVSNFFNGWIDEVRVFNTALTETQIQQTIYQEIENNGGFVHGVILPKDIEDTITGNKINWSALQLYYKMGTNFINRQVADNSSNNNNGRLFNIYTQQQETAPIPYIASNSGDWAAQSTWLYGNVWDIEDAVSNKDWSIVKISADVTANHDMKNSGLIIDSGQKLTLLDGHVIENNWYLELNGTIDLQGDAQLIQTTNSDLVTSSTGSILRRQEGTGNAYWYNYWSSPVGEPSASGLLNNNTTTNNTNNASFKLDLLKDELGANWTFTSDYTGNGSISNFWLYTYINGLSFWDWSRITTSTPINPGFGYTQKGTGIANNQQYIFEGKPNNGTILIDVLDRGGLGSEAGVSKTDFLLGNPYPSALDIHKFIDDNQGVIDGTIQLWQQWSGASHILDQYNGGYAQVNKTGSVRARQFVGLLGQTTGGEVGTSKSSRYLPVAQGFFVEIIANGTVEFNNSQRIFILESDADGTDENGSVFFKNSAEKTKSKTITTKDDVVNVFKKMRLEMISTSGPSTRRELLLGFSNITTDDYDYGYDAENVDVSDNDIHLNLQGKDMNIQAYSDVTADKVVSLNFKSSGNNTFEIKMTETQHFDANQEIYLKDALTGAYFDLTKNTAYSFSSAQGTFNDRFEIVFQSEQQSLGIEETKQEQNFVYYQNDNQKLYAKKLNASIKRLALVNILGQSVLELENVSITDLKNGINIPALATGAYVAYFRTENNEVFSKKLIIK